MSRPTTTYFLFVLLLVALIPNKTFAETKIFPPYGCVEDEIRVMGWQKNAEETKCLSGEELMASIFKSMNCTEGQTIVFSGGKAVCQEAGSGSAASGGTYTITTWGNAYAASYGPTCTTVNSKTGACSCPSKTTPFIISSDNRCKSVADGTRTECDTYTVYECKKD